MVRVDLNELLMAITRELMAQLPASVIDEFFQLTARVRDAQERAGMEPTGYDVGFLRDWVEGALAEHPLWVSLTTRSHADYRARGRLALGRKQIEANLSQLLLLVEPTKYFYPDITLELTNEENQCLVSRTATSCS